jgi:hypothetical protein
MISDDDSTVERAAAYVRGLARTLGYRPDAHPSALAVTEGLLGLGCVEPAAVREEAVIARLGRSWRVYLNARLSPARQHWAMALATARWVIARDGADVPVSAVAAALLLPASQTRRALSTSEARDVAHAFVVPEVAAVLRAGELTGLPVAHVVAGMYAKIRGDHAHVLPRDRRTLEAIACGQVRALRARRVTPTDGRGVLLLVA